VSNPYESPQFVGKAIVAEPEREKMRRVANRQQFVLYALLANIVINVALIALGDQRGPAKLIVVILAISIVIATMIAAFMLATELYNVIIGVVCALLMPVPCIALLTLLIINGKATNYLQQRGVKVGFMGVNPNTI
jgi:hypothetical protein